MTAHSSILSWEIPWTEGNPLLTLYLNQPTRIEFLHYGLWLSSFSLFVNLSLPLNSVGEYIYDTREIDSFICGSFIPFLTPVRWIQSSLEPLLGDLQISLYVFPCSVLLDSSVTSICSQGFTVGGYR